MSKQLQTSEQSMKLAELYQQAVTAEAPKFEVLNSAGEKSGHHIFLKAHDDESATKAVFRYQRVVSSFDERFKSENAELYSECEACKNFNEYNYLYNKELVEIDKALARELVTGWDFDDEFSPEALDAIIEAFDGLAKQIVAAFFAAVAEHAKK
jgi:hypothetical protein